MAYLSNIPQPTDSLAQSQAQILENFTQLQAAFSLNHVALAASGQGLHTHVTMQQQGADPVTTSVQHSLYTKDVGGSNHLFLAPPSAATPIDLSLLTLVGQTGYFYLPNDLVVQWGVGASTAGVLLNTQAFPIAFGAVPYTVMLTPQYVSSAQQDYAVQWNKASTTATTLHYAAYQRTSSGGSPSAVVANFFFIAIGPR